MASTVTVVFSQPVDATTLRTFLEDLAMVPRGKPGEGSYQLELRNEGSLILQFEAEDGSVLDLRGGNPAVHGAGLSTLFHSNLAASASMARRLLRQFGGTYRCSPELDDQLVEQPRRYERDPMVLENRLPTDSLEGWTVAGGTLSAQVAAGHAVITTDGSEHRLTLDGVHRATYLDRSDAMLEAGRMSWTFWNGTVPEVSEAETQPGISGPR